MVWFLGCKEFKYRGRFGILRLGLGFGFRVSGFKFGFRVSDLGFGFRVSV